MINVFASIGRFTLFVKYFFVSCFVGKWFPLIFVEQFAIAFVFSVAIVVLASIFIGGVLALQTFSGTSRFSAESAVPVVVIVSMTREIAPVMVGLLVSGKLSSMYAAELGSMKVGGQIDALVTLSVKPFDYLVKPRVFSVLLAMPLLVMIADIMGIVSGFIVSVSNFGFSPGAYIDRSITYLTSTDIWCGVIKACAFGLITGFIGCFKGLNVSGGSEEVGYAVTKSVVLSSVFIFIINYFITELFFM